MGLKLEINGEAQLARALDRFAGRIQDWREAWPEVNRGIENIEQDLIVSDE